MSTHSVLNGSWSLKLFECCFPYVSLKCVNLQTGNKLKWFVYAGGSGDPSRAGAVGASEEPPYQRAEEDKQRGQLSVSPFSIQDHNLPSDLMFKRGTEESAIRIIYAMTL